MEGLGDRFPEDACVLGVTASAIDILAKVA